MAVQKVFIEYSVKIATDPDLTPQEYLEEVIFPENNILEFEMVESNHTKTVRLSTVQDAGGASEYIFKNVLIEGESLVFASHNKEGDPDADLSKDVTISYKISEKNTFSFPERLRQLRKIDAAAKQKKYNDALDRKRARLAVEQGKKPELSEASIS